MPLPPEAEEDMAVEYVMCIRCRRAAKVEQGKIQRALAMVGKKGRNQRCTPSAERLKVIALVRHLLPMDHLSEVMADKAGRPQVQCGHCGEVAARQ